MTDEYRVYSVSTQTGGDDTSRDQVLEGILGYFSRLLGMQLLYKFERPQYADIMEQHKGWAFSAGLTLLKYIQLCLRLIVKFRQF